MSTENPAPAEPIAEPVAPVEPDAAKVDEPLGEPGLAALKSEREARASAEKQVKEALARVKAFEDAQKTESEKQAERIAEIERENADLKSAKTRADIATTKGIAPELISGPASGSDEDLAAYADALIAWKGDQPKGPVIPSQGQAPQGQASEEFEFAKNLFAGE